MNFESTTLIVEFTRLYLALFFTFVAVFYTTRIGVKRYFKKTVTVFAGNRFTPSWWNHMVFRAFRAAIWLVCLLRFVVPSTDAYLGVFTWLQIDAMMISGLLLLSLAFLFTMRMHFNMGEHWRSGIDDKHPATLITTGVFSFSRNPMFFGIALAQIGFFLALPSLFSLVCLAVGLTILQRQIRCEEAYLEQTLGDAYRHYQASVPRWI